MKIQIGKITIFLNRVSTLQQSLEMQLAASQKFRDMLDDDEYIEMNEIGVSANKLKFSERKKMQELIHLIKNNRVKTLFVYDRSRLTRNFYEYLELVTLLIEHNVEVIFTTADPSYPAFSSNYLIEGFNGIMIEEEGRSISRRVHDSNAKFPGRKFGYSIKKDNGRTTYHILPEYVDVIIDLYEAALACHDLKAFIGLLEKYHSILKKQPTDIIRILTDSFYAGVEIRNNKTYTLPHVVSYVSQELFIEVQNRIRTYVSGIKLDISQRTNENIFPPYCGICESKMKYRKNNMGKSGTYTCSKGHTKRKISISADVYNGMLIKHLSDYLNNLNHESITHLVTKTITHYQQLFNRDLQTIINKIERLEMEIATLDIELFQSVGFLEHKLEGLNALKGQRKEINEALSRLDTFQLNIKTLTERIKISHEFSEEELVSMADQLVKRILIQEDTINMELYFNEFINNNEIERMELHVN